MSSTDRVRRLRLTTTLALFGLVSPLPLLAQAADATASFIDREVDAAVERYSLPGIAVGVVRDGEVIHRATRGELVAGSGRAIDADSLFKIASNSKAMTGAMLARLVDQGKLNWDDPVIRHLPDFRMHEDWVSREIQVRDLLIHNSGLPAGAGDLMLWPEPNHFTRADVLHGMRYLRPKWSFRSRYAYDNTLYIVAGEVAAAAAGASYETLMQREVFQPLGLTRCHAGGFARDEVGNVAQPHRRRDDRNVVVNADPEQVPETTMAAAGGVRCSLNDMLRWASMWLDPEHVGVQADGRPWLSATQREAVWAAQQPMPLTARMRRWDGSHYSAYGYGWRLSDVDGTQRVAHTGTLSGMYSALTLLPERNVGIVLLINGNAGEARTVLMQSLTKHFTRPEANPGVAGYARLLAEERAAAAEGKPATSGAAARDARRPARAGELAEVLGVWRDAWFGEVRICPQGQGVHFASSKSPRLKGPVMRSGEGWLVAWEGSPAGDAWLRPQPRREGQPARLLMAKFDPAGDFSDDFEDLDFERVAECTPTR
ncbi:serine hydrolase domain-containing protein [Luteimonas sp. e5]